jgi:DNA anti-recombination protein RmuC
LETQAKQEQKTADRFEELTEQITTMGKEQNEQFAEAHERYVDAIADLDKKEIARWEKMVSEFNSLAGRLAEQFKQAVASLDSATARYSERVQESAQALTEQLEKVQALGTEIDKVLRTTQSMEATLRQVGSSDEFRQTLSNLRTHLTASDELLKQLSKPRRVVFQEQRAEE